VKENVEETGEQIEDFTDKFKDNINSALDDTLSLALEGNFKDIGKVWKNVLSDMLNQFLGFANGVSNTPIGVNIVASIVGAVGGIFGGGGGGGGSQGGGGNTAGDAAQAVGTGSFLNSIPGVTVTGEGLGAVANIGGTVDAATYQIEKDPECQIIPFPDNFPHEEPLPLAA